MSFTPILSSSSLIDNWNEIKIKDVLTNIAQTKKGIHWVRSDLTISNSNCFTRWIWTVIAKYFNWMRECFYDVNLEKSKMTLEQLQVKIASINSLLLIKIFNEAVVNFNCIAPKHQTNMFTIPSGPFIHAEQSTKNAFAKELLLQARTKLATYSNKKLVWSKLAKALAKHDIPEAIKTALPPNVYLENHYEDDKQKEKGLYAVIKRQIKAGDLAGAKDTKGLLDWNTSYKVRIDKIITVEESKIDPVDAIQTILDMQDILPEWKGAMLAGIAGIQYQKNPNAAAITISTATDTAMKWGKWAVNVLLRIVKEQIKFDLDGAKVTLNMAKQAALGIKGENKLALSNVARMQVKFDIQAAQETIEMMGNQGYIECAKANTLIKYQVKVNLPGAVKTFEQIKDQKWRDIALRRITLQFAKEGKFDEASTYSGKIKSEAVRRRVVKRVFAIKDVLTSSLEQLKTSTELQDPEYLLEMVKILTLAS
jgi:hypothetical protein